MIKTNIRLLIFTLVVPLFFILTVSCSVKNSGEKGVALTEKLNSFLEKEAPDEYKVLNTLMVLPRNPLPGESFQILATGNRNISKAKIVVNGPSGNIEIRNTKSGKELPCWRIDDFAGVSTGKYQASLFVDEKEICSIEFEIAPEVVPTFKNTVWKTERGWDSSMETIYSAWVNALFSGSNEQTSWPALHEVTQSKEHNFLFNYLSLDEDNPESKNRVKMEPDCADNPFFLRAYFSWKLGLPFGYHICDRGYLGRNPNTGQWITNESSTSKNNPVQAFNSFLRRIMDGVHSGTARTSLDNENSDYYPISLVREALRPGTVFADPYGHTLVLVSWVPQTKNQPGLLLAVDAQPDKTVAVKRFWKGNFLFNTSGVVGEPGFKAFRPILFDNGKISLMKNGQLNETSGFSPFSLQQRNMESEAFYHAMDRLINPKPLDPEEALADLIKALHEQLLVRVKSVANGEAYLKSHPGAVIPMPSNANGIFQTGGLWEDFSTPNRDLRLLIAIDAVTDFPDRVVKYRDDFDISESTSPEELKNKIQNLLEKKVAELTINYTRSDGSIQELTLTEILKRKDALEMAYNPNDCVETRWGAPDNSEEKATCRRHAPSNQQATMQKVRTWFTQRLHPPT